MGPIRTLVSARLPGNHYTRQYRQIYPAVYCPPIPPERHFACRIRSLLPQQLHDPQRPDSPHVSQRAKLYPVPSAHHSSRSRARRPGATRLEWVILLSGLVLAIASGVAAYRISGPYGERDRDDPRVTRFYDPNSGRLRLLVYDADGDGRFDTWSYMDGDRVIRMEFDSDGDGRVDRWEYFKVDGSIEKIGTSSRHDGQPDTWRYPNADGTVASDARGGH